MEYAIDTLLIEYHRLLLAGRKLDVEMGLNHNPHNNEAIIANDRRMEEIEKAIKILNPANIWRL